MHDLDPLAFMIVAQFLLLGGKGTLNSRALAEGVGVSRHRIECAISAAILAGLIEPSAAISNEFRTSFGHTSGQRPRAYRLKDSVVYDEFSKVFSQGFGRVSDEFQPSSAPSRVGAASLVTSSGVKPATPEAPKVVIRLGTPPTKPTHFDPATMQLLTAYQQKIRRGGKQQDALEAIDAAFASGYTFDQMLGAIRVYLNDLKGDTSYAVGASRFFGQETASLPPFFAQFIPKATQPTNALPPEIAQVMASQKANARRLGDAPPC